MLRRTVRLELLRQTLRLVQILLVGDSAVGKSSLLMRFTAGEFEESSVPTIGEPFVALRLLTSLGESLLMLHLLQVWTSS